MAGVVLLTTFDRHENYTTFVRRSRTLLPPTFTGNFGSYVGTDKYKQNGLPCWLADHTIRYIELATSHRVS
jgi:hypothetical protein